MAPLDEEDRRAQAGARLRESFQLARNELGLTRLDIMTRVLYERGYGPEYLSNVWTGGARPLSPAELRRWESVTNQPGLAFEIMEILGYSIDALEGETPLEQVLLPAAPVRTAAHERHVELIDLGNRLFESGSVSTEDPVEALALCVAAMSRAALDPVDGILVAYLSDHFLLDPWLTGDDRYVMPHAIRDAVARGLSIDHALGEGLAATLDRGVSFSRFIALMESPGDYTAYHVPDGQQVLQNLLVSANECVAISSASDGISCFAATGGVAGLLGASIRAGMNRLMAGLSEIFVTRNWSSGPVSPTERAHIVDRLREIERGLGPTMIFKDGLPDVTVPVQLTAPYFADAAAAPSDRQIQALVGARQRRNRQFYSNLERHRLDYIITASSLDLYATTGRRADLPDLPPVDRAVRRRHLLGLLHDVRAHENLNVWIDDTQSLRQSWQGAGVLTGSAADTGNAVLFYESRKRRGDAVVSVAFESEDSTYAAAVARSVAKRLDELRQRNQRDAEATLADYVAGLPS